MTLKGVLWRFALIYLIALIGVPYLIAHIGLTSGAGTLAGILLGSTLWPCIAFGRANGRSFAKSEKTKVVVVMTLIAIAPPLIYLIAQIAPDPRAKDVPLTVAALLIVTLVLSALCSIAIYFGIGIAARALANMDLASVATK